MITCIARDYVRSEKKEAYLVLISELAEKTREEPGNLSYTIYEHRANDGEFALIEEWENQERLDAHFKTEHFTRLVPQIQPLLARPSALDTYRKTEVGGVGNE